MFFLRSQYIWYQVPSVGFLCLGEGGYAQGVSISKGPEEMGISRSILSMSGALQVRIQDLVKGDPQVLRPKFADVVKWSHVSEASNLQPGSRACLRALEAFGFLMLKYAFSHIVETLFL